MIEPSLALGVLFVLSMVALSVALFVRSAREGFDLIPQDADRPPRHQG